MNHHFFFVFSLIWIGIALSVHVLLFFVKAPFGRHTSKNWGPMLNNKWGWVFMESPSLIIMFTFLAFHSFENYAWILFLLWILHYANRTLIYPLRIKPTAKKMPLAIAFNGFLFNSINASLNGGFLLLYGHFYSTDWLFLPTTILGALLFSLGMFINWRSDSILIHLRKPNETGYKIPKKFLFNYVSAPNLFGEIMEWFGFALMAWSLPALSFAIWTYANLVPRAKNHHDWYLSHFSDYPKNRKAVFPFIY